MTPLHLWSGPSILTLPCIPSRRGRWQRSPHFSTKWEGPNNPHIMDCDYLMASFECGCPSLPPPTNYFPSPLWITCTLWNAKLFPPWITWPPSPLESANESSLPSLESAYDANSKSEGAWGSSPPNFHHGEEGRGLYQCARLWGCRSK